MSNNIINSNNLNNHQINSNYSALSWGSFPKRLFLETKQDGGIVSEQTALLLFKKWKKAVTDKVDPALKSFIKWNIIKPIHLPWTIKDIFHAYIHEKIECYQLQQESRDQEIDNEWNKIKNILCESGYALFNMDDLKSQELSNFTNLLNNKLTQHKITDQNFQHIIKTWFEILRIVHIANAKLINLMEQQVRIEKNSTYVRIQLPTQLLQKNAKIFIKQLVESVYVTIPNIKDILGFFIKDSSFDWHELLPIIQDTKAEYGSFSQIMEFLGQLFDLIKECEFVIENQTYNPIELQNIIKKIGDSLQKNAIAEYSIHIHSIKSSIQNFKKTNNNKDAKCNDYYLRSTTRFREYMDQLKVEKTITSHSSEDSVIQKSLETLIPTSSKLSTETVKRNVISNETRQIELSIKKTINLLFLTEQLQRCHIQLEQSLNTPLQTFKTLLVALCDTEEHNNKIIQYSNEKYGFEQSSVINNNNIYNQNSKSTVNLSKKSKPSKKNRNNKKKNKNPALSVAKKTEPSHVDFVAPKQECIVISKTFMSYLYDLQAVHHSIYLEQAVWHMERMLSLQDFLESRNYTLPKTEQLNTLNAMTSFSHKFLEQLYNFTLVQHNQAPLEEHNLKLYHVSETNFPEAVNLLYNANNWTRYFYIIERALNWMTTQNEKFPPLVRDFVILSEGKGLATFSSQIKNIFNTAVQHGTFLLDLPKDLELGLAENLTENLTIQESISCKTAEQTLNMLYKIQQKLQLAIDHPAQAHLKQAIAALKMLNTSLKTWDKSKNHMELVTWTVWSLQQLQEVIENGLRAFAQFQNKTITLSHELKNITNDLDIIMDEGLGNDLSRLSYKPRYPVKFLDVQGKSAELINNVEALRQHYELDEGFTVTINPNSPRIWKFLPKKTSAVIGKELSNFTDRSLAFLQQVIAKIP